MLRDIIKCHLQSSQSSILANQLRHNINILADVYIHLTGGQSKFEFITSNTNSNLNNQSGDLNIDFKKFPIPKIMVSQEEILAHDQRIKAINSTREPS